MSVLEFITQNQNLIIAVLFMGSYFLKRLVDYLAARPQDDIWDRVKPASDALYQVVFKGVEYLATAKKLPAAEKLVEYQRVVSQFEANWHKSPAHAIEQLAAWYMAMQSKGVVVNPTIGPDDEATP